jgi:hypothetical protein
LEGYTTNTNNKMKKDVIKDNRTDKIYFDNGILRNFEEVLMTDVTFEEAKAKYPDVINVEEETDERVQILKNIEASFQDKPFQIFYGFHEGRMWVQVGMERPDCDDPTLIEVGKGGKAYLSPHATEDEAVKKVLGLCLNYAEHEVRECFYYKGKRLFGPHISIEAMMSVADKIVGREEPEDFKKE